MNDTTERWELTEGINIRVKNSVPVLIASLHKHLDINNINQEQNGKLIALAPEMYSQLKSLVNTWDYAQTGNVTFSIDNESIDIIRDIVNRVSV